MSKIEFHKIWIEQCEATEDIRERFGLEDAIRYLIGEKFVNYLRASETRPEFAAEVPKFAARVKEVFEPHEIREFFEAAAKERTADSDDDWPFDDFEDAEVEPRDVIGEAEQVVLIERAKELLLG
jgi:hypothetical protein